MASVSNQAVIFIYSVMGGMLIAFIYDLLRIKRRAVKTGSVIVNIEDLVYWIIVALVMFGVVFYSNDGEIRGYIFIGTVIGVTLYVLLLSRMVIKLTLLVIGVLVKLFKIIWTIITYPLKIVYKILRIPLGFVTKLLRKLFRNARKAGRSRLAKASMLKRMLKNMIKKI